MRASPVCGGTNALQGVMIRQKNLAASVAGMAWSTGRMGMVDGGETYLAYLPAAHILELVIELTCFSIGSQVRACTGACTQNGAGGSRLR